MEKTYNNTYIYTFPVISVKICIMEIERYSLSGSLPAVSNRQQQQQQKQQKATEATTSSPYNYSHQRCYSTETTPGRRRSSRGGRNCIHPPLDPSDHGREEGAGRRRSNGMSNTAIVTFLLHSDTNIWTIISIILRSRRKQQ